MSDNSQHRRRIVIAGQVQGVGFRPFVYRLATEMRLGGWVVNDSSGVTIEVQAGAAATLDEFVRRLRSELPPLASIVRLAESAVPAEREGGPFEIRPSAGGQMADAQVTVDIATCEDCLREMRDASDPRHKYPFINCTNCGPRYSIVRQIPYDRANTTMSGFPMCDYCRGEYTDPANRRFHAQPVACPKCGPKVWLVDSRGARMPFADAIAHAAAMLLDGKIIAIKGLGGFNLACRADDEHAVIRLRQRKRRDAKPFAVMVGDIATAMRLCDVNDAAAKVLAGAQRPIVVMPMKPGAARSMGVPPMSITAVPAVSSVASVFSSLPSSVNKSKEETKEETAGETAQGRDAPVTHGQDAHATNGRRQHGIAPSVAGGLTTLGVMLPYTPLHHLLFAQPGMAGVTLVMTSGNYSEEPLVKENDAAVAHLGPMADALLLHDRPIERRVDDSVVQLGLDGRVTMLRRARGYAPAPIPLIGELAKLGGNRAVLAVGAELKNAVCLLHHNRALVSEHLGDLKDGRAYRNFIDVINRLEELFEVTPSVIVADLHPQYLSTEYALKRSRGQMADKPAVPILRIQHHHAHAAACLAENGRMGPVIAVAADGSGVGDDGAVWGCEILQADLREFRRLGHLRYLRLPGGDAAAEETWRPAVAAIMEAMGPNFAQLPPAVMQRLGVTAQQVSTVRQMLDRNVNCPSSSSLGRWFDAAAALAGVAAANRFEGEAPMRLEAAIALGLEDSYSFNILDRPGGTFEIDLRPLGEGMMIDADTNCQASYMAAKFHNSVCRFLQAGVLKARELTGLGTVALSGGCFANRYVASRLTRLLEADGLEVLRHEAFPPGDGCVALGQAVIAAARSS